jgi:hypothetical protein
MFNNDCRHNDIFELVITTGSTVEGVLGIITKFHLLIAQRSSFISFFVWIFCREILAPKV